MPVDSPKCGKAWKGSKKNPMFSHSRGPGRYRNPMVIMGFLILTVCEVEPTDLVRMAAALDFMASDCNASWAFSINSFPT